MIFSFRKLHRTDDSVANPIDEPQASERWQAIALAVLTFVLYTLTRSRYNTFDAVSYSNQIENLYRQTSDKHWLFHPHHIAFNVTGYVAWKVLGLLGLHLRVLTLLEGINAVCGAVGVAFLYKILRTHLTRSRWMPMLISVGLAVSYGYWICATDGRVNMPSVALLIASFYYLARMVENRDARLAVVAGSIAGVAALYHESAGLFILVGLVAAWIAPAPVSLGSEAIGKKRCVLACSFLGPWIGIFVSAYLLVGIGVLGFRSISSFQHWTNSYSELGWWWNWDIVHNIRLDAYALRHAAFVEPLGKQGTFHLYKNTPEAVQLLYYSSLVGWFAGLYAFAVALPLLVRTHHAKMMLLCASWIVAYATFFTVWSPGYFVFWVPVLVPISILLSLALAHFSGRRGGILVTWVTALWIGAMALTNLSISIVPHLTAKSDPFRQIAYDIARHTLPGDLIVVAGAGDLAQSEVDIPYFSLRNCISLHTTLTRQHENIAHSGQIISVAIATDLDAGHRVYVFDDLVHGGKTLDALQRRHPELTRADVDSIFSKFKATPAWSSKHGIVWRLQQFTSPTVRKPDRLIVEPSIPNPLFKP